MFARNILRGEKKSYANGSKAASMVALSSGRYIGFSTAETLRTNDRHLEKPLRIGGVRQF